MCSYLLIGFWTTRIQANKAAIKAMIVNRIADLFLIMGVAATAFFYHTLDFSIVLGSTAFFSGCFMCLSTFTFPVFSVITFLFFLGAMGKSAQIGLHTWLPDAMEGPTPVSALIHAATLVTAGIFLIIRSAVLFEQSPTILLFIPDTVPVNVGFAKGATTPKSTATVPVVLIVPPVYPVPAVTPVTPCKSLKVGVNVPPSN